MKQTTKDKYLSQKGITAKSRDKEKNPAAGDKNTLGSLERLLILLVIIFVIAIPLDFLIEMDIMIYVALINYFIIGLAITAKPDLVIDLMRRNNDRFQEIYGERMVRLGLVIRGFGLALIGIGAIIYYLLVLQ